jgi:Predicted membrane protein (DUF2157)
MHSLKPEIEALHVAGVIDRESTDQYLAIESGKVFSVFYELRIVLYLSVLMLTTGIGLLIKEHYDRIGPVAIVLLVALIAAGCYLTAIHKHLQNQPRSIVGDYVLLLGTLLISSDAAFIETQFQWLGDRWSLYLLLLAGLHAVTAYALDSRLVLSVALTSLAGWFGASYHIDQLFFGYHNEWQYGLRALICAAAVFGWRLLNARAFNRSQFNEVLEHYAINLGFWAGLIWCWDKHSLLLGALIVAALATVVIRMGKRMRSEWFVVYGVVYGTIGVCIATATLISDELLVALIILIAVIGVATSLWRIHNQMKE